MPFPLSGCTNRRGREPGQALGIAVRMGFPWQVDLPGPAGA
jgi:hypothetical protein